MCGKGTGLREIVCAVGLLYLKTVDFALGCTGDGLVLSFSFLVFLVGCKWLTSALCSPGIERIERLSRQHQCYPRRGTKGYEGLLMGAFLIELTVV